MKADRRKVGTRACARPGAASKVGVPKGVTVRVAQEKRVWVSELPSIDVGRQLFHHLARYRKCAPTLVRLRLTDAYNAIDLAHSLSDTPLTVLLVKVSNPNARYLSPSETSNAAQVRDNSIVVSESFSESVHLARGEHGRLGALQLSDESMSGRKADNRPGLAKARQMLATGEADALVVAKLDRLARSTIDLCNLIIEADANGWVLVLLDLDLDTSTPAGELMVTVIAATARYESRLIGQRAEMTHRIRKAEGKRAGQAPILADDIRHRIAAARQSGESFRAIAADLNAENVPTARGGSWHASTVSHVVKSVALDAEMATA